jgi:pyruvate, water dikinase
MCLIIEKLYNEPQDIEWVIDNKNRLYILQTRPITTLHD